MLSRDRDSLLAQMSPRYRLRERSNDSYRAFMGRDGGLASSPGVSNWSSPKYSCVTCLEHNIELQQLRQNHERELEEQKRTLEADFKVRMKQFEDVCIAQYQEKVRTLEASHVSSADMLQLEAKLDAFSLSEEITKRKCEGKLARVEIVIQEYKMLLEREQLRVAELMMELEKKTRELAETRKAEGSKDSFSATDFVKLESDYKRVVRELSEEKARHALTAETHMRCSELHSRLHAQELSPTSIKPRDVSLQLKTSPRSPDDYPSPHLSDLRAFYEGKVLSLSDEVIRWKEKAVTLASETRTSLQELKYDVKRLRKDAEDTKIKMMEEATRCDLKPQTIKKTGGGMNCGKTWCSARLQTAEETRRRKK